MKQDKEAAPFRNAILATTDVADGFREGLQAIKREHTQLIKAENPRKAEGSVDLDACLKGKYGSDSRWDYAIGYDGACYFAEVHKAETSEINTIIKKQRALVQWLNSSAMDINALSKGHPTYSWVATNGVHFLQKDAKARILATHGIAFPKKILILK